MQFKARPQALKVALIYVLAAGGWILFSDELLQFLIANPETRVQLSILKGWGFVLVTGGLLFVSVQRLLRRWEREAAGRLAAMEQLRTNEEKFRLVMEATADGLWDLDFRTGIAELSPRYWEITGYAPGELVPDMACFQRLVHPEDWPRVLATWNEHLAGKSANSVFEYRLCTKDGTEKWILGRGKVVARAPDGSPLRMVGTITEITERKLAEAALRQSQEHYALVEAAVNDGFWDWNILTNEDHFSPRWKGILGYEDHEVANTKAAFFELLHPEDVALVKEVTRAHAEEAKPYAVEFRLRHKDGSYRWVFSRGKGLRDAAGQLERLVGAITDITERKQAEAALRASEARYHQLFELESDALFLVDAQTHRFVEVNQSAQRLYGYRQEEFLQMQAEQVSAEPEKTRMTVGTGNLFIPLRWHRKKNGDRFPVEITASLIQHQGRPTELTAVRDITARQQAMVTLQETTEQLLEAQHLANLGYYRFSPQTGLWTSSKELDDIFGIVDPGFVRDMAGWLDIIHPEERVELRHYLNEAVLKIHTPFDRIYRIIRLNDRQERWVHGLGKLVLNDAGQVVLMVGVIQDITERKRAEVQATLLTQRLKLATDAASIGIWDWDLKADRWFATDTYFTMLGYEPEEGFADRSVWLQRTHPDERATVRDKIMAVLAGEAVPYEYEARMRHADGSYRWHNVIGRVQAVDAQGKPSRLIGVRMDITERKRAEEQMHLQFSALTAAANAIVITGPDGKIEWVNPSFTRLTGYSAEEAIGNYPRVLKSNQHPPEFYADLWETITAGQVWHGELVNQRKDGKIYTEDMTITPVRGADGVIAHFVAIKQDVTERRQLEKQLRQAQKLEAVGTLAGGIAHDFNNILGAIISFTEVSKMDRPGDAELQENLDEVLKASQRATALVRQILSFSRQQQLERRSLQLAPVVKEVLKLLRSTLPSTITIEPAIAADLPDVLADPTQMHQVMMNLCTNAAHAMRGQQGQLRVQMDALHLPPDEPRPNPELAAGDYVRLIISDTGHGMDAATLERIFEPFFTTKGPGEGTGLGLSVVHGIVKEHGGVVAVESQPGGGTTFTIYLPAQPVSASKEARLGGELPKGRQQRVMFVDDEAALGKVALRMLQQLGYQPFVFSSAEAAWNAVRENPTAYDALITDQTMPVMTGVELAARVFQLRPELPIILSSGNASPLPPAELQARGIRELLHKPNDIQKLALALDQVFREPARSNHGAA